MSGHNKWSQIKRKKETQDQRRGKEFGNLAKEIRRAVAEGGRDPQSNATLRAVLERARAANMPKANVEKAILRGEGKGGAGMLQEAIYEAYGPGGGAILIESRTDNKNRTTAELKHLLALHGGSLAGAGSVLWIFKGHELATTVDLSENEKEAFKALIEAVEEHEDVEGVKTNVNEL